MTSLGVIADTHIPDRARTLDEKILPLFKDARVNAILHAGDVSIPRVLNKLSEIAPVYAVRGNRDWLALGRLPYSLSLSFEGVNIALAHGHGHWWNYLSDKVELLVKGYRLERYRGRLLEAFPDVQVIVFGHTHRPINHWVGEQLVFNPGSPHFPGENGFAPSVGLLHISSEGKVWGEIIWLDKIP